MRNRVAVIVVVTLFADSGCMIVPTTQRTLESTWIATGTVITDDRGLALTGGRFNGRVITARVVRRRWCTWPQAEVSEYRVSRTSHFVTELGDEPYGWFAALLLAPATIPISGIVTAIRLHGSKPSTEQTEVELAPRVEACDAPVGGVSVWLAVIGAELLHATTDAGGEVRFQVDRDVRRGEVRMGLDGVTPPTWPSKVPAPE
jgi:hypothetical protein